MTNAMFKPCDNPDLDLQDKVDCLASTYEGLDGEDLVRVMEQEFPGKMAVVTSFGTESAMLLDVVAKVNRDLPVFFINTTMQFPETLAYKKELTERLGLTNVQTLQIDYFDMLALPDDECCGLLKGDLLDEKMEELGIEAWVSGLKNFQGGARENARTVQESRGRVNINPLVPWDKERFDREFKERDLPSHPLSQTFSSVGCTRCTMPSDGTRAEARSFCGLHPGDRKP